MVKVKIRSNTHTTTIIINYLSVILTLLRTGHTPQGAVVSVLGVSVMRLTLYTFFPVAYPDISSTELWIYSIAITYTVHNKYNGILRRRDDYTEQCSRLYMYLYRYIIIYLFCIFYCIYSIHYNIYIYNTGTVYTIQ